MDWKKMNILEMELRRKRLIERMLEENGRDLSNVLQPQPPRIEEPVVIQKEVHVQEEPQPSTSTAIPPAVPPSLAPRRSNIRPVSGPRHAMTRAETLDSTRRRPRMVRKMKSKSRKDAESPPSSPEPPKKSISRPMTAGFRPRTAKERKVSTEDLERTVESIIASVDPPKPVEIEIVDETVKYTSNGSRRPSKPIVFSPTGAVDFDVNPEIVVDEPSLSSATRDADVELGEPKISAAGTMTEKMEIFMDIDRNPEKIDQKTAEGKPPFTQTASIEIQEPSDESLPQSPVHSGFLQIPSEATSGRTSSLSVDYSSDKSRTAVQSRLSFIVQEKLHHFASDLRRRTSELLEDITQEDDGDLSEGSEPESSANPADKNASLMSLIGLREQESAQEEQQPETRKGCIPENIDPFGTTYLFWTGIVVVAFFYNCFCIPLRCTFPYQTDENLIYWLIVDYLCDAVYVADIVLIKPRLIFMRGGITITDRKELAKHYFVSRMFKLDIFCVIPFDFGYFFIGPVAALRICRCFKIVAFWEFFDLLDSSFSNPYVIRITRTFCYMIYLIHCNACVYYMLSAWQAFGQLAYRYKGQWYLNKWVYNNQGNAYIRCFYFMAAIATSTGNNPPPTNTIEYSYMIFSWMMGVFVFAVLLGQIRDIVYNANKNAEEFRSTMDKALGECKRLDLPPHVVNKVRDWFRYTWEQQKTLDEKKLVDKLPLKLQTDLALSVHYNTLSKVQMFQGTDRALLRDLVLKLTPVIFLPQEMVCRKGDVGKEMYIVNRGILEVVSDLGDKVFATLSEGTAFGEISLLAIGGNNRRTANIRSKGYSTLFVLSKQDLNDVIKDYPDAQQSLKRKARQMLKKDQTKVTKSKKDLRDEMAKKCEVSAVLPTPKMLEAVRKLLPQDSKVAHELDSMIHKQEHPGKLKRWSTIPDDFSDASDTEFQRHLLEVHEKSKSLDEGAFLESRNEQEDC